jgi:magnesium transporter
MPGPIQPRHRARVLLSSTALLPFLSVRRAAALAIAQLGVAAFFVSGVTRSTVGESAPWFVLAATVLAGFVRAIDIESWALLIPGGFVRRITTAFGKNAAAVAAAVVIVERLLLAALASIVIGHYVAAVPLTAIAGWRFTGHLRAEDLAMWLAVLAVGLLWIPTRLGRSIGRDGFARGIWIGLAILLLMIVWGVTSVMDGRAAASTVLASGPASTPLTGWLPADVLIASLIGVAVALPVIGGGEVLTRAAQEVPAPRVQALKRMAALTVLFAAIVTTGSTFLVTLLVPLDEHAIWLNAPLAGLAQHLAGPSWARDFAALAIIVSAVLLLIPAAHAAFADAQQGLYRLAGDGILPRAFRTLHMRFGTPARAIDVTAAAVILVVVASGGRVPWLGRAYAISMAVMLLMAIAALVHHRHSAAATRPFRTPLNFQFKGRALPFGLIGPALIVGASVAVMLALGDIASIASAALVAAVALWFTIGSRDGHTAVARQDIDRFDLVRTGDLSVDQIEVRPGGTLVPVRNPHAVAHVVSALEASEGRDVVVMTVRLINVDVDEEAANEALPTQYEQQLLSQVLAVAEQRRQRVHLLIVPARNVVDAIIATVVRLRSTDVYVGESSTLSAADQARLLGEAWERTEKPDGLDVRLVIGHRSGRADTYHLGAHPPSLTSADLDLIHRVWIDAVKAIGPHVHHHDVVRAALTQMEEQLTGPDRDAALAAIREAARPAEELAAVLRVRDYARLRDMLRNRHAGDVAALLTGLTLEDRVVVFRVLPRKDAAAVFEYLSREEKEALLKTLAQDDVAALLNNMAPDERTMFLEELPAAATRELLALLTPGERQVALTLLGYPEESVGRLMTPHYVAVREHWTVREVLDHVRAHGRDSETLNVIYVVDDQGLLIDDIRIREFLLAPLEQRAADLMDRRFVALTATDNQEAAVGVFRQYDRSALPVTDTAGMLIGIVTIDDVLDVAEATATREIQRIGGSEALDEPYITIAFGRMIKKRAGWLTALFLGEMLTATAMGAFEEEIEKAVVLALFVPLIISSGGNSGSQAATLVIRALALNEVGLRDWWRVMRREILAGLALGAILGSIGFLRITLWSAFSDIYGPHWLLVAITVSVSLVGVVLWGTFSGSLLPFLLRRLGFDPAASSAPFVATLVDVTGLVIYFSVALTVLRGTLL